MGLSIKDNIRPKSKEDKLSGNYKLLLALCAIVFSIFLTQLASGIQNLTLYLCLICFSGIAGPILILNIWYIVYDKYFKPPDEPPEPPELPEQPKPPEPPKNLLVVIANFEPIPGDDKDAKSHGETVSADLEIKIRLKVNSGVPMEYPIRHKQIIEGATEKEKKQKAREIGLSKGAHLVLWGSVQFTKLGKKWEFYLEPKITIVQPLGPTELEERQPGELRASLSNPEILELRRRKIEETVDIVCGLAWYKQKDYQGAINIFKEFRAPDAEVFSYHGAALVFLGRFDEALKQFDKAIEINPQDALAWGNKGVALDELGRYEEAITCYDKAIEINSKYAEAWYNKGVALGHLGRYEEAITYFDKAIEIDPRFAWAWGNKGNALADSGKYEDAIKCYDKALEINPQNAEAWYNKGVALGYLGRYEEAVTCYDNAIEINPRFVWAWGSKGVALGGLGRYEEAIACLDEAIELDPQLALAWDGKGLALSCLGRHEKAIEAYRNFIKFATPQDAELVQKAKERIRELQEKIKQK